MRVKILLVWKLLFKLTAIFRPHDNYKVINPNKYQKLEYSRVINNKNKKNIFYKDCFCQIPDQNFSTLHRRGFSYCFFSKASIPKMAFFFHDMYIQAIFCCKASFKNGTFERFSSFMHWRHVFSSANLILQNMRIDDLFSSWTDAKCLLLFVSKIAHKNCIEKVYLLYTRIDFMRSFKADLGICTGKSLSEALILASLNSLMN